MLVATVGALASLATSTLVNHWESDAALEQLKSRFQVEARERVVEIRQEMQRHRQVLRALRAFFHSSEAVTREEFRAFANELTENISSVKALGWVPRVGDAQRSRFEEQARIDIPGFHISQRDEKGVLATAPPRDEYFPLYFVEPGAGNEEALGFDQSWDAVSREALYRAVDSGRFAVSGPIFRGQDAETQASVIAYLPIYSKGALPTSEAHRRQSLEGLALVVIQVGEMLQQAVTQLPSEGIGVRVFDATHPSSPELLYVHAAPASRDKVPSFETTARLRTKDNLEVGGRRWEVSSELAPGAFAPIRSPVSRLTLAAGLLITGLIAWYVRALQRYGLEMARANLALDREVAGHRQTGEALKESEQQFRRILESAADAILISDGHGRIHTVNQQAERLFGYARPELIGQSVELLLPDQMRERHAAQRREYFASPKKRLAVNNQELSGRRKDGSLVPLEISLSPSGGGQERRVTAIIRDISARKATEAELHRLNRTHAVLSRSSSSLARSVDEKDLLASFCANAVEAGGYCFAWVGYAQQDNAKSVRLMGRAGRTDAEFSVTRVCWSEASDEPSPCGIAIRTGNTVVLRDIEREPGFKLWRVRALRLGYRSMIALPLRSNSHTFGNFSIFSDVENAFNDKEVELLEELAKNLAFSIETVHARAAHERKVRLLREEVERDTRKRIAANLHDGVAQTAQAVNLSLKGLRSRAAQGKELPADLFNKAIHDVGDIIGELREVSQELRPLFLERMGLIDAIRYYCSELAERAGIDVCFAAQDLAVDVGERVKEQCFLVVREALTNAVKHAGASRIDVVLEVPSSATLTLRIADDGGGFDPARQLSSPTGLGLSMMSERAESVGGTARVRSTPGSGTTVTISVPLGPNLAEAQEIREAEPASVAK